MLSRRLVLRVAESTRHTPEELPAKPEEVFRYQRDYRWSASMSKTVEIAQSDVEAERSVLAAVIFSGDRFCEVSAALSADDFSVENHRRVFRAMQDLSKAGETIDRITLAGALRGN